MIVQWYFSVTVDRERATYRLIHRGIFAKEHSTAAAFPASADAAPSQTAAAASTPATSAPAASATATKAAKEQKQKTSDEWSADEQAALERALKSVGKDVEDRWEQIAALVGSKSKKQCVARFKHIREQIMKQSGGK